MTKLIRIHPIPEPIQMASKKGLKFWRYFYLIQDIVPQLRYNSKLDSSQLIIFLSCLGVWKWK
ncbi:hypothetical protein [Okeania sp. SIO2B3]|uniref:hypothetical protein n=1 Tax=Okeania sp. SIO2B3 TaxID=2607784 RepID=UPI0013C21591|nr:hypothetical protein [Okeania sp. SIO2B3]NET45391.1 hypothetical protein [Okeania sp. SIO2B3]